jgi:hypothetical protein
MAECKICYPALVGRTSAPRLIYTVLTSDYGIPPTFVLCPRIADGGYVNMHRTPRSSPGSDARLNRDPCSAADPFRQQPAPDRNGPFDALACSLSPLRAMF